MLDWKVAAQSRGVGERGRRAGLLAYAGGLRGAAVVRVDTLMYGVALAMAAFFIGGFVVAALFRLSYPFALQLTEPASLSQVERVLHGQALYVQPTLDYVPMIYGPVYFYFS